MSLREEPSSAPIEKALFGELKAMINAANEGGGAPRATTNEYAVLTRILNDEDVKKVKPKTSEATYAIGAVGKTIYASGPEKFMEEVEDNVPLVSFVQFRASGKLGQRSTFLHGESFLLTHDAKLTAVVATQPNCLFCYGYLEYKGIDHQEMREHPFPKGWIHPSGGWQLKQVNPSNSPKGMLVWIGCDDQEALYRIDKI